MSRARLRIREFCCASEVCTGESGTLELAVVYIYAVDFAINAGISSKCTGGQTYVRSRRYHANPQNPNTIKIFGPPPLFHPRNTP